LLIFTHQVILLNNLTNEKIPDVAGHFLDSFQENPSVSILFWINQHFNPFSKHLFADKAHRHQPDSPKNLTLCLHRWMNLLFGDSGSLNKKTSNSGSEGFYRYLFVEELLIPPKYSLIGASSIF
jgi:hypothetical protein